MLPPLLALLLLLPSYGSADDTLQQADAAAKTIKFSGAASHRAVSPKQAAARCAEMRDWGLRMVGFPPFPPQYEEASKILTRMQTRLVEANDLRMPGLCPVVILPSDHFTARNVNGIRGDGRKIQLVVITTRMLRELISNDSELALIIGHELRHMTSGNYDETLRLEGELSQSRDGAGSDWPATVELRQKLMSFHGFEMDADHYGAVYLVTAGYSLDDALKYFDSISGEGNPLYPATEARQGALQDAAPALRKIKTAGVAPACLADAVAAINAAPLDEKAAPSLPK